MIHMTMAWKVGEYVITEYDDHGRSLFAFEMEDGAHSTEYYDSLDMALIAMVGQKYTGPRGAGGPNVGTAADWFARMIGLKPNA